MAVTTFDSSIVFTTAGDAYAGKIQVRTLVVMHTTAAATVLKNGAGNVILTILAGAPTGAITIPFGDRGVVFDGLEYDAGTGGMTAFLA